MHSHFAFSVLCTFVELVIDTYVRNKKSCRVFSLQLFQPIFTVIGADEETKKLKTQIQQCMVTNAGHLVSYLHTWDNCRELWDINKDAFIRRYERAKPLMSKFDADISR